MLAETTLLVLDLAKVLAPPYKLADPGAYLHRHVSTSAEYLIAILIWIHPPTTFNLTTIIIESSVFEIKSVISRSLCWKYPLGSVSHSSVYCLKHKMLNNIINHGNLSCK